MAENILHFIIPLRFAWTDTKQDDSAEITLEADGASFQFTPIGGVLDGGTGFTDGTVQWRAKYVGTAKVTVALNKGGQTATATGSVLFADPRPLEIDLAEVPGENGARHVLLRGSIRIPFPLNGQIADGNFVTSLAALWPVSGDGQVVALRVEPAGLYLGGKLPAAMFPSKIPAIDGNVTVVLRVHQPLREDQPGRRFWTLESFDFGENIATARELLRGYAEDTEGFKLDDKSFIDNVVAAPTDETAVRILIPNDEATELVWQMLNLRQQLRVQLGGGKASEAAFHPDELTGKVKKENGSWGRAFFDTDNGNGARHHVLMRAKDTKTNGASGNAVTNDATHNAVTLSFSTSDRNLEMNGQRLCALSLSAMPLSDVGARSANNSSTRARSWLCTDRGWLAVDAAPADGRLAGGGRGAGAIRGVIELEKLMAYLLPEKESGAGQHAAEEAAQEPETGSDALQVQLATLDTSSVVLGIDYSLATQAAPAPQTPQAPTVNGVHLFLGDPLTTVITPGLWYVAPPSDESGALAQPTAGELLPALSAAPGAPPLASVFQRASFISVSPEAELRPDDITAEIKWKKAEPQPDDITAEIAEKKSDDNAHFFYLKLMAKRLRLWHPIPDVPLAQSFSRTPDPNRDSTLDSNRGLIPFEPKDPSVTLEFPGLPNNALPKVTDEPKSWQDLAGFTVPASQFPTRYFLPTLPGVEATLPISAKDPTGLRWGYRHAVPALDEAYAEVVEEPTHKAEAVQTRGALDMTRVEGAEAFEIRVGEEVSATGWLRQSKDNLRGETTIKIESFERQGSTPQLKISLKGLTQEPIVFDRNEKTAGLTGDFGNGEKIRNNGQSLGKAGTTTTQDGVGLELDEITSDETTLAILGKPEKETRLTGTFSSGPNNAGDHLALELMGVRLIDDLAVDADTSDETWMLHDGEGDWPSWHGWPLYPVKLTELQQAGDKYTATIEVVLLPRVPTPPVFALNSDMIPFTGKWEANGTNMDGGFTLNNNAAFQQTLILKSNHWVPHLPHVTVWRKDTQTPPRDTQIPARVIYARRDTASLECTIDVGIGNGFLAGDVIKLKTAVPESTSDVPPDAGGRLKLGLILAEGRITDVWVERIEKQDGLDWRFTPGSDVVWTPPELDQDGSTRRSEKDVSLLRLRGAWDSAGDKLTLTSLAVKHPLGVISIGGDNMEKDINLPPGNNADSIYLFNRRSLDPNSANQWIHVNPNAWNPCMHVNPFDYSIKLAAGDPYFIQECVFVWTFELNDPEGTVVKLDYSTGPGQEFPGSPWWLRVCKKTPKGQFSLVGPLCLEEPQTVAKNRLLFNIVKIDESQEWWDSRLKSRRVAGVVGIQFSKDRLTIESLTADIQVEMEDRYPNDAIMLWDPVRDVMRSIDRNVGILSGKGEPIGPAGMQIERHGDAKEELFWADRRGRLCYWRLTDDNMVREYAELPDRSQFTALVAPEAIGDKLLGVLFNHDTYESWQVDMSNEDGAPNQEGSERAELSHVTNLASLDPDDAKQPITAVATSQPANLDQCVAWAIGKTVQFMKRLDLPQTLPIQADDPIRALCICEGQFEDEGLLTVVVGVAGGTLVAWKVKDGALNLIETIPPVSAARVTAVSGGYLIVADPKGELALIDVSKLIKGEQPQTLPIPAVRPKDAPLEAMVSLGINEHPKNKRVVSFAVLYSATDNHPTSAVFVYEAAADKLEGEGAWKVRQLETLECRPQRLSHLSRRINDRKFLIITGPAASSRLLVQVHIKDKHLRAELTGRLTIHNNLDYVVKHPNPDLEPHCTHRIDLHFDRATVPAEAIFWNQHQSAQDTHTAALAHHVFRFPDGHERVWQAPQMVRFTSLERYAPLAGITAPADRGDDLVLDASAVFWLQPAIWAEAMRYGVGAAAIANDDFRLWLLPRELRSFELGLARVVRLPAIACWAFDNAPFEVRRRYASKAPPEAPPKAPRIEIQMGDSDPELTYWTSGVQRPLGKPEETREGDGPTYFARGTEAAWLDAEFLHKKLDPGGGGPSGVRPAFQSDGTATGLPNELNDLLWLRDQLGLWLHEHVRLYCLEHQADQDPPDPIQLLADTNKQLVSWRANLADKNDLDDIDKFTKSLLGQPTPSAFAAWLMKRFDDPKYRAQYTDFIRGDSAFLASATLAHVHDVTETPKALAGPALFEYPYRLRLEERSGKPDAGSKFDAQLLVFDPIGAIKCVAHEQLAPEDVQDSDAPGQPVPANAAAGEDGGEADKARKQSDKEQNLVAEKWARGIMERRRRFDAGFVLVNFTRLIPVPRRFEAAYEEMPFTLDAPLGGEATDADDTRRRLPGLQRAGEIWQRTRLAADPNLGLRVFSAEPAVPTGENQKSVAATRFRLARADVTGDHAGVLAPALVEPSAITGNLAGAQATSAQPQIVALSRRDDVPFQVQSAGGDGPPYPLDAARRLLGQVEPIPTNLEELRKPPPTEGDGQPASLLPPLVDVVSWAARPGEMMRSSFSANVYEYRGKDENPSAENPSLRQVSHTRHPVAVSLRRPRARSGEQESVRLALKQSNPLLDGRFQQAEFLLQQYIDQSTPAELGADGNPGVQTELGENGNAGVQIVVTNRTDVFKSFTDIEKAQSNQVQIPVPDVSTVAKVYLVVNDAFLNSIPQDDKNDHLVLQILPNSWIELIKKKDPTPTRKYFTGEPSDLEASPAPLWLNDTAGFEGKQEKLRYKEIAPEGGFRAVVPADGGILAVVRYTQHPSEQTLEKQYDPPKVYAALNVKLSSQTGRFIPPKMSISLLSRLNGDPNPEITLAGYGRLGAEDFDLIEPVAGSDALIWMRTAALRVIHRDARTKRDQTYDYDVVAYGPGGELLRTE